MNERLLRRTDGESIEPPAEETTMIDSHAILARLSDDQLARVASYGEPSRENRARFRKLLPGEHPDDFPAQMNDLSALHDNASRPLYETEDIPTGELDLRELRLPDERAFLGSSPYDDLPTDRNIEYDAGTAAYVNEKNAQLKALSQDAPTQPIINARRLTR